MSLQHSSRCSALLVADIFQAGEISLLLPIFCLFQQCMLVKLGLVIRSGLKREFEQLLPPLPASITHKSMHKRPVLALCTPAACPGMDKSLISAQTHHLQLHHSKNGDFRALCLPLTAWKKSSWLPALTHKHTHSVLAASSELLTHWNIPVSSK